MILANGMSNAEGQVGDAHVIPTAALGANEGDAVKSYISSTANPTATIDFRGTQIGIKPAPVVASSLAWTDAVGPTGLASDKRRTEFNILSPSMAWPHGSGAAKLLKDGAPRLDSCREPTSNDDRGQSSPASTGAAREAHNIQHLEPTPFPSSGSCTPMHRLPLQSCGGQQ
ncbi:hypothetical protein NL676_015719 [Syzygium grande]|nr:hypothetical protein NL676_015719 [Syzygium grande]